MSLSRKDTEEINKLLSESGLSTAKTVERLNEFPQQLIDVLLAAQQKVNEVQLENEKLSSDLKKAEEKIKEYDSEISYAQKRLNNAIEVLMALATLDFDKQAQVTDKADEYDGLATGLNMLGQELKSSTVSVNYLEDIFQSMSEVLIVVNEAGVIQSSNPAARDIFGNRLVNNDVHSIIAETTDLPEEIFTTDTLQTIITKNEVHRTELIYQDIKGNLVPLEVQLSPMQSRKGVVIIARNIDERKRAELRQNELVNNLEKSNSELRQFAYVASHDLKAPLRAISMLAQWVKDDSIEVLNDESKSNLDMLIERTQRMYSFLDGMLAYSRIGINQEQVHEIDLNQLVDTVVSSLDVPQKINIKIGQLPTVKAAELHMVQVYQNLISNAINYMDKEDGIIEVGMHSSKEGEIHFYVKDNGPGIEEAYFEKVFIIFQTLQERDNSESTGIGLTIVKKILEGYGGKIWLESEVGQGSCFHFTLPKSNSY